LQNAGLITVTEKETLLPGREMQRIALSDIVSVVRVQGETGSHRVPHWNDVVSVIGEQVDSAVNTTLGERTLSDLLDAQPQTA
jgi:hypothetical protein